MPGYQLSKRIAICLAFCFFYEIALTQTCPTSIVYNVTQITCNGSTYDLHFTIRASEAVPYFGGYANITPSVGALSLDCQDIIPDPCNVPAVYDPDCLLCKCGCDGNTYAFGAAYCAGITEAQATFCNGLLNVAYTLSDIPVGTQASLDITTSVADPSDIQNTGAFCDYTITLPMPTALSTPASISGPATVCPNQIFSFTSASVSGATTYTWTVPAGATISSGQGTTTINVNWGTAGAGNVCVTASGNCKFSAQKCKAVTLSNNATTASFTQVLNNLTANFTNTSGNSTSYLWNFGDGQTSTATNPSHTYASAGTYSVCLTATGSCGTAQKCQNITVSSATPCTTVTTTADAGAGSLREAINCANNDPGPDTIRFAIPGAGQHIIYLISKLPDVYSSNLVIDGTTQSGWAPGNIVLDGSNILNPQSDFLEIYENSGFEMYGLTAKNAPSGAFSLTDCTNFKIGAPGKGNIFYSNNRLGSPYSSCGGLCETNLQLWYCNQGTVKSNWFGVTELGAVALKNTPWAMTASGQNIQIGGSKSAGEGNVFANSGWGLGIWSIPNHQYTGNIKIYGNSIGTDESGTLQLGNDAGINFGDTLTNIEVGGGTVDLANTIKYNNRAIDSYDDAQQQVWLHRNTFACNTAAGFGACTCGTPPNDYSATITSVLGQQIKGTGFPGSTVEVYRSDNANCPNAGCQGTTWLGSVLADASGNWTLSNPVITLNTGDAITATGTFNGTTRAFAACFTVPVSSVCTTDSLTLVAFYNATGGPNWTNRSNWLVPGKPIGTWFGVTLGPDGCVQCLDMDGDGLSCNNAETGNGNNLIGQLPPEIGQFSNIKSINLYNNKLSGALPSEIGNLATLENLQLDVNLFSDEIPSNFYNLHNLSVLGLNSNNFSGTISPLIGNLTNLTYLTIGNNLFSGQLPQELGTLNKLIRISLGFNRFSGAIPTSIAQLSNLNTFFGNDNIFDGVSNLTALPFKKDSTSTATYFYGLRLANNKLTFEGVLPNLSVLLQQTNNGESRYAPQDSVFADTSITRNVGQYLSIDLGFDAAIGSNIYQWYHNGNPISPIFGDNKLIFPSINLTDAGDYWVHITNPNAPLLTLYSRKINLNVPTCTVNTPPNITGPIVLCSGAATLQTGSFAQYAWSNGLATPSIIVTQPGTYTVTVTDSNGCTGTDTQIVGASVPAPTPNITGPTALCSGTATLQTGNFALYNWSNGLATPGINITQSGTYTVTVTDSNGCTGTDTQIVGASVPAPTPNITGPTALCSGMATLQTGNFALYNWSNGLATPGINITQSGTYTVTVTDSNGCTGTGSQIVGASVPAPTPVITGPVSLCGGMTTLQTGNFAQYNWSNSSNAASINVTQPGAYTVTATDSNGCTGSATKTVINSPVPTAQLIVAEDSGIPGDMIVCAGDEAIFTAGGGAQYQFWVNGVAQTPNYIASNVLVLPALANNSTVEVHIIDANACRDSTALGDGVGREPIALTINPTPDLSLFNASILPNCPGDTLEIRLIAPNIPTGTYSVQSQINNSPIANTFVQFTGGFGLLKIPPLPPQNGAVFKALQIGDIGTGCSTSPLSGNTLTFEVKAPIQHTIDTTICTNQVVNIGGQNYSQPGTYMVPLKTANNCDSTVTLTLKTVNQHNRNDEATFCSDAYYLFYGDTLRQPGPYQHLATGIAGCDTLVSLTLSEQPPVYKNLNIIGCSGTPIQVGDSTFSTVGVYQVKLKTVSGCDSIINLNLQIETVSLSFETPQITVCQGINTTLTPTIQGCQNCQFKWNTGSTQPSISIAPNSSSAYSLSITSSNGCKADGQVNVTVQAPQHINLEELLCPGDTIKAGGQNFTLPGSYMLSLQTLQGCDSTIALKIDAFDNTQLMPAPDNILLPPNGSFSLFNVIENDFYASDFQIELVEEHKAKQGIVTISNNDALGYALSNPAFYGIDSFQYALCPTTDCPASCVPAWVYVRIQAGNLDEAKKLIPNLITPNGDGVNDSFDPIQVLLDNGIVIEESELYIINRWGETVYDQKRDNGMNNAWDGMQNGKPLPQATYYYRLKIKSGETILLRGPINLLR